MPGYGFGYGYGLNQAVWSESDFLIDRFPATAAYSLRKLSADYTGSAIRVRRDSDNAEQDIAFSGNDLDTAALESFVKSETTTLPADFGSGAAAAYSLRYVTNSYSGAVIRVREDGLNAEQDFTPSEITDGTLASFCGGNNGFVVTWYDQSGNSNDATQATAGSQPKIYDSSTGVVLENGKAAIDFDGVDDILNTTSGLSGSAATGFVVYTPNFGGGSFVNSPIDIGSTSNTGFWPFNTQIFDDFASSTRNFFIPSVMPFTDGNQSLVSIINDNVNKYFYVDSVIQNTVSDSISFATTVKIGGNGSVFSNCNLQDVIIYNSDQSANRTQIEYAINDYYNIYTPTANGFVTTWYDQAGSNNATQVTAGSQPKIYDSSTGIVLENGKPAVEFDGVDDGMTTTNLILGLGSNNSSLFVAASNSTNDYRIIIEELDQSTSAQFLLGGLTGVDSPLWVNGTTYSGSTPAGQLTIGFDFDGTNIPAYVNGALQETNTPTINPNFGTTSYIGKRFNNTLPFSGKIQEIIGYQTNQSSNRTAIETNINAHYNIYP